MNEQEKANRFNRELDKTLRGKRATEALMPDEEKEMLELALRLAGTDFSAESRARGPLRKRLAEEAARQIDRQNRRQQMNLRLNNLVQAAVWVGMVALLVIILTWAFSNLLPQPAPAAPTETAGTGVETATADTVVVATDAIEAGIATPESAATGLPAPTPEPAAEPLDPFMTGAAITNVRWLPDGSWLTFLSQTPEDVANSPAGEGYLGPDPGTIHFYNPGTGERCQYAEADEHGLNFALWSLSLADGRLAVLTYGGELVALVAPCSPETATILQVFPEPVYDVLGSNPDNTLLILRGETSCWIFNLPAAIIYPFRPCSRSAAFSPGDKYLGVASEEYLSDPAVAEVISYTVSVFEVSSGELSGSITRTLSERGVGDIPAPAWLDENRFLVHRTDDGPLLVTLENQLQVQAVAPEFFGKEGTHYQYGTIALGADGETFHLLMHDSGPAYSSFEVWLYHSENGAVERLPFSYAYFSRDGQWLDLSKSVIVEGYEQYARWQRPVDPPGNEELAAIEVDEIPYVSDSPDWDLFAQYEPGDGSSTILYIFELGSGKIRQTWKINDYAARVDFYWSPDSRFLAAVGTLPEAERAPYDPEQELPGSDRPANTLPDERQALFVLAMEQ